MFRITEDPSSGVLCSAWLKLQKWFYRVRWHGGGRCYGSICWSNFKYFIILIVSTYYIFVHKLDNKVSIYDSGLTEARSFSWPSRREWILGSTSKPKFPGSPFSKLKRLEREDEHSPQTEVKNAWNFTSTSTQIVMVFQYYHLQWLP